MEVERRTSRVAARDTQQYRIDISRRQALAISRSRLGLLEIGTKIPTLGTGIPWGRKPHLRH
jgi:hypothetical protein